MTHCLYCDDTKVQKFDCHPDVAKSMIKEDGWAIVRSSGNVVWLERVCLWCAT